VEKFELSRRFPAKRGSPSRRPVSLGWGR
jgi:hypothetical protein